MPVLVEIGCCNRPICSGNNAVANGFHRQRVAFRSEFLVFAHIQENELGAEIPSALHTAP
jgi:hypothetical protein